MICPACSEQQHASCIDTDPETQLVQVLEDGTSWPIEWQLLPGRVYRSCDCQHKLENRLSAGK